MNFGDSEFFEKAFNSGGDDTFDRGAVALHDMFESYVRAGFTEEQAMEIITTILSVQLQKIL